MSCNQNVLFIVRHGIFWVEFLYKGCWWLSHNHYIFLVTVIVLLCYIIVLSIKKTIWCFLFKVFDVLFWSFSGEHNMELLILFKICKGFWKSHESQSFNLRYFWIQIYKSLNTFRKEFFLNSSNFFIKKSIPSIFFRNVLKLFIGFN